MGSHSIQGCRGQSNGCLQVIFHKIWVSLGIFGLFGSILGFFGTDEEDRFAIDELWDHTQLRVVKDKAMVVCRYINKLV